MATIIRAADSPQGRTAAALNFADLEAQADRCRADAEAQAAEIVAEARQQAEAIRQEAAQQGAQAAVGAVDRMVAEQLAPTIAALRQVADEVRQSKQSWLGHWESSAVRLASAIAARVIRGELRRQPEIPLRLVREALELSAGSPDVRLRLHPEDYQALGPQVRSLVEAMSGLGGVEVAADAAIGRGGCRVETRFGAIDQQFDAQLGRIEEELIG